MTIGRDLRPGWDLPRDDRGWPWCNAVSSVGAKQTKGQRAWHEGYRACQLWRPGSKDPVNPYPALSNEAREWTRGYIACRAGAPAYPAGFGGKVKLNTYKVRILAPGAERINVRQLIVADGQEHSKSPLGWQKMGQKVRIRTLKRIAGVRADQPARLEIKVKWDKALAPHVEGGWMIVKRQIRSDQTITICAPICESGQISRHYDDPNIRERSETPSGPFGVARAGYDLLGGEEAVGRRSRRGRKPPKKMTLPDGGTWTVGKLKRKKNTVTIKMAAPMWGTPKKIQAEAKRLFNARYRKAVDKLLAPECLKLGDAKSATLVVTFNPGSLFVPVPPVVPWVDKGWVPVLVEVALEEDAECMAADDDEAMDVSFGDGFGGAAQLPAGWVKNHPGNYERIYARGSRSLVVWSTNSRRGKGRPGAPRWWAEDVDNNTLAFRPLGSGPDGKGHFRTASAAMRSAHDRVFRWNKAGDGPINPALQKAGQR